MTERKPSYVATRREWLLAAAAAAAFPLTGSPVRSADSPKSFPPARLRIAWIPGVACVAPLPLALSKGIYKKYNLEVELVPFRPGFKSPTREMITAPQRGEADAVVAMVCNFLRPMAEDGVNLKFVTAIHGGCVRVVGSKKAGVTTIESLRGKVLAMPGELRGEDAIQLFPAMLKSWGLRPEKDIFFRWGPDRENPEVLRRGDAQAYMQVDPIVASAQRQNDDLVEIINTQTGPFANRACCVVTTTDEYMRKNPLAIVALHHALQDSTAYMMKHYQEAAALYAKEQTFGMFTQEDIATTMQRMDNHCHRVNQDLLDDITFYADALKHIGGFKDDNLDTVAFAKRVTAQVPV